MKNVLIAAVMLSVVGCTSDIQIVGQGDVTSSPVGYPCSTESSPCVYSTAKAVNETFVARTRSGYLFAGWQNCPSASGTKCYVKISQSVVDANQGETIPGLVAQFAPVDSVPVVVTGCTVRAGLNRSALCRPLVGDTVYINRIKRNANYPDYEYSSVQVVNFDNRWFHGGYAGGYALNIADSNSEKLSVIGPLLTDQSVIIRGYDVQITGRSQ